MKREGDRSVTPGPVIALVHGVAAGITIGPMRTGGEAGSVRRRQGRYELGELLGRGGMAEVFAGHTMGDHGFSKPVAIKRLLPELANDEVFVERLIEEAKLLVGLAHGNIVSVMDLARDGDDVFLVMEFVDGPSLRQLMKARGTRLLSLGVATYAIIAAATGLEFAHQRGVIHADISPSNVLLTTSGEVRVADFGIARRGDVAGPIEGKWAYMAPEQARGEALSPTSDVFALGVSLYELLTGMHPFGRQVTQDDRSNEPLRVVPPRVVVPSISPGLDAICMRMLAVERRDRYATMQQVIDALTDERFNSGLREGASDLANAIKELRPSGAIPQPPTVAQVTKSDRPHSGGGHTIVTRSLLTPVAARSASEPVEPSSFAKGTVADRGLASASRSMSAAAPVTTPVAPRAKWPFAVLGAAALLGIGVAVALSIGGGGEHEFAADTRAKIEPEVASAPAPLLAPEDLAKVPAAAATMQPTLPAPEQPVAVAPVVVAPTRVVTPPRAKPAPVAPAAKKTGTFRLSLSEWAYASIDGGAKQEVSIMRVFTLPAGKHTVRIFKDTVKPVMRTIVVEANETAVLRLALESSEID